MPTITQLTAREILDSRGRPTVKAYVELESGAAAAASVPSGASTGAAEALELRDEDSGRYGGLGCLKAVANITGPIAAALTTRLSSSKSGRPIAHQEALDHALLELDGTPNKSRLGANALLAVSIAFARAVAVERRVPLYQHFADMIGQPLQHLPRLTVNLFSGGKHAGGQVAIQDVLVIPRSATTIDAGLADVYAVYQAAVKLTRRKYQARALTADEGGLAPPFPDIETMLGDAVESITEAGLTPGTGVALAVDVASSHFHSEGGYDLFGGERAPLAPPQMIEQLGNWAERYPIVSIEDGLAEDDWEHWPALRRRLAGHALTLGDDLLCTNPARIGKAIEHSAADALLLKVNQIGTLSEAAESLRLARAAGWRVTISARSGETEDDWLADLAVGWAGDQIKIGSITRSERLAKYNRLLEIEDATRLPIVLWP